jgi:3-deoxy-manno-octulosonate cytidylyltransferase (CMP-KDO synthetase)
MASTRLPGKPLADIAGQSLIERVYKNAAKAKDADFVVVATDTHEIEKHVNGFGTAVLTDVQHPTGTDRINEAVQKLKHKVDVIVNIQGDEPFLEIDLVTQLVSCFENKDCDIATAYYKIDKIQAEDPNTVKLVKTLSGRALYFSRSKIPFERNTSMEYFGHIGLYAYRINILPKLCALKPSALEKTESLEQLRWLENGYQIYCVDALKPTLGIDTPEDLEKAISKILAKSS